MHWLAAEAPVSTVCPVHPPQHATGLHADHRSAVLSAPDADPDEAMETVIDYIKRNA
jgi:hypothetical protein